MLLPDLSPPPKARPTASSRPWQGKDPGHSSSGFPLALTRSSLWPSFQECPPHPSFVFLLPAPPHSYIRRQRLRAEPWRGSSLCFL